MTANTGGDGTFLPPTSEESISDGPGEPSSRKVKARLDGLITWAVLSIGLLVFIAFGSVDARIWRFNNLRIERRSVLRIWTLQAESLPTVAQQWMLSSLFYTCIFLIIACVVACLWFLLDSAGTGASSHEHSTESERDSA